jgi:hypothetical protein
MRAPPSAGWMQGREVTITATQGSPFLSLLPLHPPPSVSPFGCAGVVIGSTPWITSYPATWWNQMAPASIYVDDTTRPAFSTSTQTFSCPKSDSLPISVLHDIHAAVGMSTNYTTWVASKHTTVYTSLVDCGTCHSILPPFRPYQCSLSDFLLWWVVKAVLCLNLSYMCLSQDTLVEVVNGPLSAVCTPPCSLFFLCFILGFH